MSPGVHKRTPPSRHAMDCLARAARTPYPAQEVNFTVRDKLLLFGYAALEDRPSPYKTHPKGRCVPFLVCTPAGNSALALVEQRRCVLKAAARQGFASYTMSAAELDPVRAIRFALTYDDGFVTHDFLTAWLEGALAEWPDFKRFCELESANGSR